MKSLSEIFFPQLFRAATFGERPRQAADAAHLLLLAGSQRRCSFDRDRRAQSVLALRSNF